jgi:hypothetical protein
MNKRIARLLRRGADRLDPPKPHWTVTPLNSTNSAGPTTYTLTFK